MRSRPPRSFRVGYTVGAIALLFVLHGQSGSGAASGQDDREATIAALETTVAEQATTIADLRPTDDDGPTPTVAAPRTSRAEPGDAAEPIPLGNDLRLDYYYLIDDEYGNVRLFGEVSNDGDTAAEPYIQFVLYDDAGNVLATLNASSPLPALLPGDSIPIEGFANELATEEIASEDLSLCETFGDPTEYGPDGLELRSVVEEHRNADSFSVRGEVFNLRGSPVERVKVEALVYRADGRYAGSGATLIQAAIPSQRSARFDLLVGKFDMAGLSGTREAGYSYELWAGTSPGGSTYMC